MRLIKFSLLTFFIGLVFFGLSYTSARRLPESARYSYPESVARHYAQVSGSVFEGSFNNGKLAEIKKTIPMDPNAPVDRIEIESVETDVEISLSPTDEVQIDLASTRADPSEPILIDNRSRTLRLLVQEKQQDVASRMLFSFHFDDSDHNPRTANTIHVRIPKSLMNAQIRTISGDARVSTTLENLHFQSKSGDIRIGTRTDPAARVANLTIETVSGDLNGTGRFDQLRFNSVSGDLDLSSFDRVLSIDAKTVSGSLEIKSVEPIDAEFAFSTKSGNLKFDKDLQIPKPSLTKHGDQTVFKIGNGTSKVQFQTVSGSLKVEKATSEDLSDDDES